MYTNAALPFLSPSRNTAHPLTSPGWGSSWTVRVPGTTPAFLGLGPGKQEQQQEVSSSVSGLSIPARALPHPSHCSGTPTMGLASPSSASLRCHLGGSQALPLLLLGSDPLAAVGAEQAGGTGRAAARGVCHSSRAKVRCPVGDTCRVLAQTSQHAVPTPWGWSTEAFCAQVPWQVAQSAGTQWGCWLCPQARHGARGRSTGCSPTCSAGCAGTLQPTSCSKPGAGREQSLLPSLGFSTLLGLLCRLQGQSACQLDSNIAPRLPTCKD